MEHDLAAAILRVSLGLVFIRHGWNHGFGSGGIDGTTQWFSTLGLRPAKTHALISTYGELLAGVLLVLGLVTSLAAAIGVGVMTTAFITVHRRNGFFTFNQGEGYEYVLTLGAALTATGVLGAGTWSIDHVLGVPSGVSWGLGAAVFGVVASLTMLAACWRPVPA